MNTKQWPLLAVLLAAWTASARDMQNGEELLKAMHARYEKSWYETLTFTQRSTTYNADGTSKSAIWHEAALLPGKLRIDVGTPSDNNGFLLVNGQVTVFRQGQAAPPRHQVNMLLVLGFDVYRQAPEQTISITKDEGFDLNKIHEDSWEGRAVYVVGAAKGDVKSKQFWVDKEKLLFVRLLEPGQADPTKMQDIRFNNYRELAGGWVAPRVDVHVDGKMVFTEDYSEMEGNPKLDPAAFDPKQYTSTHWEKP